MNTLLLHNMDYNKRDIDHNHSLGTTAAFKHHILLVHQFRSFER